MEIDVDIIEWEFDFAVIGFRQHARIEKHLYIVMHSLDVTLDAPGRFAEGERRLSRTDDFSAKNVVNATRGLTATSDPAADPQSTKSPSAAACSPGYG